MITARTNLSFKIYFIEMQVFFNDIFVKAFLAKLFVLDKVWLAIFSQYILFGTSQFALYMPITLKCIHRVF